MERSRLESSLTAIRKRLHDTYTDRLDGKTSEEFWLRKINDWRMKIDHFGKGSFAKLTTVECHF
jgi:hypothetical protein